jgi:glycosyltransferase involved in cell wall biosynthesis
MTSSAETEPAVAAEERPEDTPELSVVMPCLNEAATLAICIRKAQDSFDRIGISGEVVVADNGSTDGSQEIAEELGARVVPVERRGYGAALTGGIAAARGRWVIMGDADDSYDFSQLEPFIERLRAGYDPVAGNRFKGGIHPGAMPSLHKWLGNPFLSFVARRLYRTPAGDIYCGLRGFDCRKIEALDIRASGMEFAIEMIVKASNQGLRVTEVPTTLCRTRRAVSPPQHVAGRLEVDPAAAPLQPKVAVPLSGPVPPRSRDRRDGLVDPRGT